MLHRVIIEYGRNIPFQKEEVKQILEEAYQVAAESLLRLYTKQLGDKKAEEKVKKSGALKAIKSVEELVESGNITSWEELVEALKAQMKGKARIEQAAVWKALMKVMKKKRSSTSAGSKWKFVSFGDPLLDRIFSPFNKPWPKGGLPLGEDIMVSGKAGSGKSEMARQLLANALLPEEAGGLSKYEEDRIEHPPIIVIDTEGTITLERIAQMYHFWCTFRKVLGNLPEDFDCKKWAKWIVDELEISDNYHYFPALTVREFVGSPASNFNDNDTAIAIATSIADEIGVPGILIIDSLSAPFRAEPEYSKREKLVERRMAFGRIEDTIKEFKFKRWTALYTNQVMDVPQTDDELTPILNKYKSLYGDRNPNLLFCVRQFEMVRPWGGSSIIHLPDHLLYICSPGMEDPERYLLVSDSIHNKKEILKFILSPGGLVSDEVAVHVFPGESDPELGIELPYFDPMQARKGYDVIDFTDTDKAVEEIMAKIRQKYGNVKKRKPSS